MANQLLINFLGSILWSLAVFLISFGLENCDYLVTL